MKSQHTPGPWQLSARYSGQTSDEWYVASLTESPIFTIVCGRPEARANAKLIAAAPVLLAALQALFALGDGEIETPLTQRTGWNKFESQAREAIALATQ